MSEEYDPRTDDLLDRLWAAGDAIAARDARIAMLEAAIVAMAEDGWLMYGNEDMDAVQQLCYDAYLTIKQPKKQGA